MNDLRPHHHTVKFRSQPYQQRGATSCSPKRAAPTAHAAHSTRCSSRPARSGAAYPASRKAVRTRSSQNLHTASSEDSLENKLLYASRNLDPAQSARSLEEALEGTALDSEHLERLLIALRREGALTLGTTLLRWALRSNVSVAASHCNVLIEGYMEEPDAADWPRIHALVNYMQEMGVARNAHTYTILLRALCSTGLLRDAEALWEEMLAQRLPPEAEACVRMMQLYAKTEGGDEASLALFAQLKAAQAMLDSSVYHEALDIYCKGKQMDAAVDLLQEIEDQGLVDAKAYNYIIRGLGRVGKWQEAGAMLERMQTRGVAPTEHIYLSLFHAYEFNNQWELALELSPALLAVGGDGGNRGFAAVANGHAKRREWDKMTSVLQNMRAQAVTPDFITYGALAVTCSKQKQPQMLAELLEEMRRDGMDADGYAKVLQDLGQRGRWSDLMQAFEWVRGEAGCQVNAFHYSAAISGLAKAKKANKALQLLDDMKEQGVPLDVVTYTALMKTCSKSGKAEKVLELFDEMCSAGLEPNTVAYTVLVTAVAETQHWRRALEALAAMRARGLRPSLYCYSAFIRTLGLAGEWQQALDLFQEMKDARIAADATLYNTLISVLEKNGQWDSAMAVHRGPNVQERRVGSFSQWQGEWFPVARCATWHLKGWLGVVRRQGGEHFGKRKARLTHSAAVKAFVAEKKLEPAWELFDEMKGKEGTGLESSAGASLVTACIQKGKIEEALEVYIEMKVLAVERSASTCSELLAACCKARLWQQALAVMQDMRKAGAPASASQCKKVITACARENQKATFALEVYEEMKHGGIMADRVTFQTLINLCFSASKYQQVLRVYNDMLVAACQPDSRAYDTVLSACVKLKNTTKAEQVFVAMKERGRRPSKHTYGIILQLYSSVGSWRVIRKLLDEMRTNAVPINARAYNALIQAYGRSGDWQQALAVSQEMAAAGCPPTSFTYTSMVTACAKAGEWDPALEVFKGVQARGEVPSTMLCNSLIAAFDKGKQWELAVSALEDMWEGGFEPDTISYNSAISACARCAQHEKAVELLAEMRERGMQPNTITYTTCISACEKRGEWEQATMLMDEMKEAKVRGNTQTYNMMLSACGKAKQWERARSFFEAMPQQGVPRDIITYCCMLNAFLQGEQPKLAEKVYEEVTAGTTGDGIHVAPNAQFFNSAVDLFCSQGCYRRGVAVLEEMKHRGVEPDHITYTSLIKGCLREVQESKGGRATTETKAIGHKALRLFHEMKAKGLRPTSLTYTSIIAVCSKTCLCTSSKELWEEVCSAESGVERNIFLYNASLAACERCDEWERALDLLIEMKTSAVIPDDISLR
ncbi:hypothetical protein CYMTET_18859 [Cymbomonas tetramitiformis]|uniref:PROP1-like PPR domain-containing protein n=1 Tax=Cymbomonas tetramitiformis TaxID=36881 RepID=A0AAE0G791_9CHLO|nr:hypothetical protein CYMTET_18859 [Cymbomonas tetramitiformis]